MAIKHYSPVSQEKRPLGRQIRQDKKFKQEYFDLHPASSSWIPKRLLIIIKLTLN